MKKQLMSSIVCFALLVVMFLGSSIAWFTDEQANVNVMVAGKIAIEQNEWTMVGEGEEAKEEEFSKVQYVMMPSLEIVKKVVVENTGNQPAYVRTLFAFEDSTEAVQAVTDGEAVKDLTVLDLVDLGDNAIVIPGVNTTGDKVQFSVIKDGITTTYTVGYYEHGKLHDKDDPTTTDVVETNSYTCLNSITLDSTATSAWSYAVKDTYEVFVLTQAVQITGFEDAGDAFSDAFGAVEEKAAEWFRTVLEDYYTGMEVQLGSTSNVITVTPERVDADTTEDTP